MTTTDLDLGVDFNDLQQEEARANRPSFRTEPIEWEGDLTSIGHGTQTYSDGSEHPKLTFTFEKTRFMDVGNAVGQYRDGDPYILFMDPVPATVKPNAKRFTMVGKSTRASGANLDTFLGSRVHVTEIAETYKNAAGYDRQSYHWQFKKVGAAAPASTEIPPELVNAALQVIGGGEYTEANVGINLMKSPSCNTSAALNGKFADGSFIKDMLSAGRLAKGTGDVLVVAGN